MASCFPLKYSFIALLKSVEIARYYIESQAFFWLLLICMSLNSKLNRSIEGSKAGFVNKTETPGLYWPLWYDPCNKGKYGADQ